VKAEISRSSITASRGARRVSSARGLSCSRYLNDRRTSFSHDHRRLVSNNSTPRSVDCAARERARHGYAQPLLCAGLRGKQQLPRDEFLLLMVQHLTIELGLRPACFLVSSERSTACFTFDICSAIVIASSGRVDVQWAQQGQVLNIPRFTANSDGGSWGSALL
jgi:hypothetical protein